MSLLAVLATPSALSFLFMATIFTRETLHGGRKWQ